MCDLLRGKGATGTDERFHVGQYLLRQFGAVQWYQDALIGRSEFSLPGSHQQHRTRGAAQYPVGHAAEDPVADTRAPMRGHRDQVCAHIVGEGQYLVGRPAGAYSHLDLGGDRLQPACHFPQVLLQFLLDALPFLAIRTQIHDRPRYSSHHRGDREQVDLAIPAADHLHDVR